MEVAGVEPRRSPSTASDGFRVIHSGAESYCQGLLWPAMTSRCSGLQLGLQWCVRRKSPATLLIGTVKGSKPQPAFAGLRRATRSGRRFGLGPDPTGSSARGESGGARLMTETSSQKFSLGRRAKDVRGRLRPSPSPARSARRSLPSRPARNRALLCGQALPPRLPEGRATS